ncbi:GMC family oxidoreductase [Streptomyces sp. NL15-2K]|nr:MULTISPECIES: GMC family oxidoreductase [Actinomycetes]WKX16195.1 GMC family oxidoreductase [Kutzneria buriramensis]
MHVQQWEETCDVLVLGGGTAGCLISGVLARRLPKLKVTLVDSGTNYDADGLLDRVPQKPVTPGTRTFFRNTGAEFVPAPSEIGGSSLMHGGIALRGTRDDHDEWFRVAGEEWSPQDLASLFHRLESDTDEPAVGSPLHVAELTTLPAAYRAFHAYCARVFGAAADLNRPEAHGVGLVPSACTDGRIATTYRQHILPDPVPANLRLRAETVVDHVRLRGERVDRVAVRHLRTGRPSQLRADVVVLAAGALGTPEILLRSGIGAAAASEELGIPVALDLPAVGARLRDHSVLWSEATVTDTPAAPPWPWHAVLCRTSPTDEHLPDCSFELFHDFRLRTRQLWSRRVVISCTQLHDISPGRVRLEMSGTRLRTRIDGAVPRTLAAMEQYAEHVGALLKEEEFQGVGMRAPYPVPYPSSQGRNSAAGLLPKVRSAYHFHGTCPMGTDPGSAVVSPDLRVFGTGNLYVADASVLPVQFGANTHHVTRATALRAADALSSLFGYS